MRKNLMSLDIIRNLRRVRGMCPVCGKPLKYNIRTGKHGQWAHFIRDTEAHINHYGKEIVDSPYNGILVCDLECNNAVQLSYGSRPLLCDELAEDIRIRMDQDREREERFREVSCG